MMVEYKLTKKFDEMGALERLRESLKMLLFSDLVVIEYESDAQEYGLGVYRRSREKSNVLDFNEKQLENKLIETQKLLAKYNCEHKIEGYEMIKLNSEEYKNTIEPYKTDKLVNLGGLQVKIRLIKGLTRLNNFKTRLEKHI